MDIWNKYKSPLGYFNNSDQIDSYGVNHSGFNTGDELNYQCFRQDKEQSMINDYNSQGITDNYPQFGTDFWGTAPDNNYGFGTSNIAPNIENMKQESIKKGFDFLNIKDNQQGLLNAAKAYNDLLPQKLNDKYKHSVVSCIGSQGGAMGSLGMAMLGTGKEIIDVSEKISNSEKYGGFREILKDSMDDLKADALGIIQGNINPSGDCYKIIRKFYSPTIK